VRSLAELGLAIEDGGRIALAESARSLSVDDVSAFAEWLQCAVLAPENNDGLGVDDGQGGPRDLTQALAWFMSLDPLGGALRWKGEDGVEQKQRDALRPELGLPLRNEFRWGRFVQWAPALGFATRPIFTGDERAQGLAPDCTGAVRRTVLGLWGRGESVDAVSAVARIRAALPVLPGGAYAESLGLSAHKDRLDGALSFALLCGDAERLPVASSSVDACTIAFGLRNVTHLEAALAEARRVLKPGGRFFCLEFSRVVLPVLARLYDLYSFEVVPRLGRLVAGDRDSYQYLVESIRRFPPQDELLSRFEQAGFERVRYRNLTGGIAALHSGWRL